MALRGDLLLAVLRLDSKGICCKTRLLLRLIGFCALVGFFALCAESI
jgi:hypothetical protein